MDASPQHGVARAPLLLISTALALVAMHLFMAPPARLLFGVLPAELALRLGWVALAILWLFLFARFVWRGEEQADEAGP